MKEPFLEPIVRKIRFQKALKHIKKNSTVIDIGCGHTPHFLNRLSSFINNGLGVDQLIKDKKVGNIKLISCLLTKKIPCHSNTADHVTLLAVLEHLENPEEILQEVFRILKPTGTIIMTTPTPASKPILELLSYKLGLIASREIKEHKRYYWGKNLTEVLKRIGFKKIRHQYFELFLNNFIVATK